MIENEFYLKAIHEMRNSVALIDGYFQLLEKKQSSLCQFDYWEVCREELSQLRSLILNLSQNPFENHFSVESVQNIQEIDLREFLTDCCQSVYALKNQKEISYSLTTPQNPLIISADSQKLSQAIKNLLKNACEAIDDSGKIDILTFSKGKNAYITITDSGCGISPDKIANIFEPFTTTKPYGNGLGLNITRQIISAHGGSITVQSPLESGSCFTITLPLS